MTVFSSSIPWLPEGSYSRFGYYACRHHDGDRSAAASRLYELDMAPVNALLDADNSDAERCRVWELFRPPEMEPLKRVDEVRYRLGLPNTFDLG